MSFTIKLLAAVALVWLALSPPLFTDGACTAEFDAESRRVTGDQAFLGSPVLARAYWNERSVPFTYLTPEQCRARKPRTLDRCGDGVLVIAKVPVKNTVCSLYRDDEIRAWLQYDARDRLVRVRFEMNPYKLLPVPGTSKVIDWGR